MWGGPVGSPHFFYRSDELFCKKLQSATLGYYMLKE